MKMKLTQHLRHLSVVFITCCVISTAYAGYPLWTFTPNPNFPPNISMRSNQTGIVVYTVQNQSHKAKSLMLKSTPGVTQSLPCNLNPVGQPGSSCSLVLAITGNTLPKEGLHTGPILCETNLDGTPNANQCYRPSSADNLNINLTQPSVGVTITVDPFILFVAQPSSGPGTGTVTVTNEINSSDSAKNVTATIPSGSGMSLQSTTCGNNLAIGASCTMTFATSQQLGPITIPVKGDNTNTTNIYAESFAGAVISVTGPAQQSRIVPTGGTLDLIITNDPDSIFSATSIQVSNKTACPNLSITHSTCSNVAPGASCTLTLSSSTPYAPCTITVSGSNTANSPTVLIAFSHLGGLVFESNGNNGKVVIDAASEFSSEWTFPSKAGIPGAMSDTDGVSNTNAIVVNYACTNQAGNCAAYRCRTISADWYLPAKNELQAVIFALCPNSSYPCAFGNFQSSTYWSSTQGFADTNAYDVDVPDGNFGPADKHRSKYVRCIRNF